MTAGKRILDIDMGNSALKYRCGDASGRLDYAGRAAAFVLPELPVVDRVRVSSVLGEKRNAALSSAVAMRWGVGCEFARSVESCAGVVNGYVEPATLGVDRWLAMLAAFHQLRGPVLVVDLGTAATLDYVTAAGVHLGGFIVPGMQLMRRSLLSETAAIRFEVTEQLSDLSPGMQTRDAVERGVLLSLVQLVSAELERFDRLCDHNGEDQNSRLVLCGGDATLVSAHLQCSHSVVADLVLDGLALALPDV